MRNLPERLTLILNDVVSKHCPHLLAVLQDDMPPSVDAEQRSMLRQACGDELCATGLTDADEPNERGFLLEELIDWLGHE